MTNKNGIIALTIVIALISVYNLSFTFVSRSFKSKAIAYATDAKGEVDLTKKQHYIDSLWREEVYLGHTLQDVTERELNLGLDLQGGMHVVLEVAPADILKGMAGGNARSGRSVNCDRRSQSSDGADGAGGARTPGNELGGLGTGAVEPLAGAASSGAAARARNPSRGATAGATPAAAWA